MRAQVRLGQPGAIRYLVGRVFCSEVPRMSRGLTVKGVEALSFERDGHRVADRDGLYVRLSPAGAKSYQLRATIGQERPWITLGTCEDLSLAAARELGAKVRELLRDGVSLARIRVALKGARSARTLEAHLPAEGGLGGVLPDEDVAGVASVSSGSLRAYRRPPSASSASAVVVPLSYLRWEGGARGRG